MLLTPQSQNTSFFDKLNSISPTSPISKVLKTVIFAITITLIILSTQSATAINSINTYDDQLALSKHTPLTHTNSAYNTPTPTTPESSLTALNQRHETYSHQTPPPNKHLRHLTANFLQRTETKPSTSPTATYNITVLFLSSSVSTQPNKGLHHYKFRHYSAELGRWPGRDPIGEKGGVNLYGFVGNDGINLWDALGRKPQIVVIHPRPDRPSKEDQQGLSEKDQRFNESLVDTEEGIKKSMTLISDKYKNLQRFEVASTEEANKKLIGCGDCIQNLYLEGHGASDKFGKNTGFSIGGEFSPEKGTLGYKEWTKNNVGYQYYVGFEVFKNVKFCKGCVIMINGCEIGKSIPLLNAISMATGCKVRAYNRVCMLNGNTPGAKFSMPERFTRDDVQWNTNKIPDKPNLEAYIGDNALHQTPLTPMR